MGSKRLIDNNLVRRGYELKHLFFGRPIRPFHFAVMISTGTIGVFVLARQYVDINSFGYQNCWCDWPGILLSIAAIVSASMLFLGWWIKPRWSWNQSWFSEWGLLLAIGVWLSRSVYVLISDSAGILNHPAASALLSLAWAIGAAGSYFLERYDHVMEGGESE